MQKLKFMLKNLLNYYQKNRKIILIAIVIIVSVGFLYKQFYYTAPQVEAPLTRVQVSKAVYNDKLEQGLATTASLKAIADVEIKSKVAAPVQRIFAKKNQRVRSGDLLIELEHDKTSAKLASATAQIDEYVAAASAAKWKAENAISEQQRYDTLIEKGYATRQEVASKRTTSNTTGADYEQAVALIEYAKAEKNAAASEVNDCLIRAPFDGMILNDFELAIGSKVTTDSSVIRIADISKIKCSINIPENKLQDIKDGMIAEITCETFPGEKFEGIVSVVNTFIDTASHTFQADIIIDNIAQDYKLLPGMFAKVFLIQKQSSPKMLTIPSEAISKDNTVMIVKNNKISIQKIIAGVNNGKNTAIIDGLSEGDVVVINGGKMLQDGNSVSVSTSK